MGIIPSLYVFWFIHTTRLELGLPEILLGMSSRGGRDVTVEWVGITPVLSDKRSSVDNDGTTAC